MTVVMETGEKWALIEVFEIRFSSSVDMEVERGVIGEGGLERVDSEHECELMIEALQRELALIRDQLALLTHNIDITDLTGSAGPRPSAPPSPPRGTDTRLQQQRRQQPRDDVVKPTVIAQGHTSVRKVTRPERKPPKITAAVTDLVMQKHYLGVVDAVEDEGRGLRQQLLRLMHVRVEQQLCAVREVSRRLERRRRRREQKERTARLRLKPPRYRSQGTDDRSFLDKLHHSIFYQIVGLEHELRRSGQLASLSELKEFWDIMLAPGPGLSQPQPSSSSQHPGGVEEEGEEEGEGGASWAITALPPEHYRDKPSSKITSSTLTPTPTPLNTPFTLPRMRPIADILGPRQPLDLLDKPSIHSNAHALRLRQLGAGQQRVRHMYQQARANEMVMRRLLLPQRMPNEIPSIASLASADGSGRGSEGLGSTPNQVHERLDVDSTGVCEEGGRGICGHGVGVTSDADHVPEIAGVAVEGHVQETSMRKSIETESDLVAARTHTLGIESDEHPFSTSPPSRPHTLTTPVHATLPSLPSLPSRPHTLTTPVHVPLSMDALQQKAVVMEPQGRSAVWCNYVSAGRGGRVARV